MTHNELSNKMQTSEFVEWIAIFEMETEEQQKAEKKANKGRRR